MAIQCADTESLVQTYLDGELADTDADALQAHLDGCLECNQIATEEARFLARLRERLTPPGAPEHLRGRIMDALDRDDWQARKKRSSRWNWTLPAASSLAAVAALLFFFVSSEQSVTTPPVADEAVRQHLRRSPAEVTGAKVSPFVREHFSQQAHVPRFSNSRTGLLGARLSHVGGHDAAQLYYNTEMGNRIYDVTVLVLKPSGLKLCVGERHVIGGRRLCLGHRQGMNVVTHTDERGWGYMFVSEMDGRALLEFVGTSDLLLRTSERPRPRP